MDKIKIALKKLNTKERSTIAKALEKLTSLNWTGLDIVKLKGTSGIFRIGVGQIRIIFFHSSGEINILELDRRSEKTYRNF